MMITQLGKKMRAKVIPVSKDNWIKDFEAVYSITEYDSSSDHLAYFVLKFCMFRYLLFTNRTYWLAIHNIPISHLIAKY